MVPNFHNKLDQIRFCVEENGVFIEEMTQSNELFQNQDMGPYFETEQLVYHGHVHEQMDGTITYKQTLEGDVDKVKSTLRQFVREWSTEVQN